MKKYVLYGKPKAKQRVRVTKYSTYDPQADEKADDKMELRKQYGFTVAPKNIPLDVEVIFYMPIPKSTNKKKRQELITERHHHKKPDLDNLIKYTLDVANGILFDDDSRISSIFAEKIYDTDPRTEITILKLKEDNEEIEAIY